MRLNLRRNIYMNEICDAAGVSERGLRYAFEDLFGTSPNRYLSMLRLCAACRSLSMADSSRRSVKAIALSCGLLSRFADNYRKVFGELPRDTLMRAPRRSASRPEPSPAGFTRHSCRNCASACRSCCRFCITGCRFRPWICRNARLPCRIEVRQLRCNAEMSVTCLAASPLTFQLFVYGEMLMNRIYRRVWNRQLNALVVASELATGDSGGSAARDPRTSLLMPTALALALLCVLASGHAGASETNQSLRDLQALAAKYAQPMPVKVDAEVALAAAARQAQSSPALSADARVGLQLNTTSRRWCATCCRPRCR